jgi:hypothetical protein
MNTPTLCPKTPETFHIDRGECEVWPAQGSSADPLRYLTICDMDRRFLARYQFCAWMDRADRWARLYNLLVWAQHDRRYAFKRETRRCERIANTWREWEKQP